MIVVPVAAIAAAAVTSLLMFVDPGGPQGQIDLIKTGLTVGAGTGGVVALVLNGRRQWSTEHDATERRLTELYLKAVEQLGSDKPAVRIGGLYALERVAQDNANQRQTVVDVVSAYLRAPYSPPRVSTTARPHAQMLLPLPDVTREDDSKQEREVRLTAQRILVRHLNPGAHSRRPIDTFWHDIDIDLSDATLIDFRVGGCRLGVGDFRGARFVGEVSFEGTSFAGEVWFVGASFEGYTRFTDARFESRASFEQASFAQVALFSHVSFENNARFVGVNFDGDANFGQARFDGDVSFEDVTFTGDAWFHETNFAGITEFHEARFNMYASFEEARFAKVTPPHEELGYPGVGAWFDRASFAGGASFDKANFTGGASFSGADFTGSDSLDAQAVRTSRFSLMATQFGQGVPKGLEPFVKREVGE